MLLQIQKKTQRVHKIMLKQVLLHLLCKCVWESAALTFSVVNISPSSPC